MATARRAVRGPRSSSGSRQQYQGRSTPPSSHDEILAHHQTDDELSQADGNTRGSRSRGQGSGGTSTRNSPSEDLLDGTTRRVPHGTPTTPPGRLGTSSLLTSGHTHCRSRTTTTTTTTTPPRRTTNREEEEEFGEEVLEEVGKGTSATKTKHHHNPHHPHHPHHSHHRHQGPTSALLIFICLLTLAGIYSVYRSLNRMNEEQKSMKKIKPIGEVYNNLKLELQSLNREFSQPREVWLGLLGQLEGVMVEEPPQPAIFLLVVPDDSRGAATCLAHHLAKAVQYAFEDSRFVMFDTHSSQHLEDSAALKLDLDNTLRGLAEAHAAVVHNVESLPGHAAMILHAYCDNENAPFKQAVIFLLVEVPGTYKELAYSRIDTLVDSHLAQAWMEGEVEEGWVEAGSSSNSGGLKEKDVSALISRTANAPLLIRPERPARMMEMCPV